MSEDFKDRLSKRLGKDSANTEDTRTSTSDTTQASQNTEPHSADSKVQSGFARKHTPRSTEELKANKSDLSEHLTPKEEKGAFAQKFAARAHKGDHSKVGVASLIYLVRGTDQGRPAWYYCKVHNRASVPLFEADIMSGHPNLLTYADILHCGWGEDPPEEIAQKMKDEYGV